MSGAEDLTLQSSVDLHCVPVPVKFLTDCDEHQRNVDINVNFNALTWNRNQIQQNRQNKRL